MEIHTKQIVIIDNHPIYREGIKRVAERTRKFKVVGEAGTEKEGLRTVQRLVPDLVVMEIMLHEQNTIPIIHHIKENYPEIQVVILTLHREVNHIVQAFEAGAAGYFLKETEVETFLQGCESVLKGDQYLDKTVSPVLIASAKKAVHANAANSNTASQILTSREKEITRLVVEGFLRKEIADILCISAKTVENHISNIMRKLSLHNTIELVRWAAGLGLINMEEWSGKSYSPAYRETIMCKQKDSHIPAVLSKHGSRQENNFDRTRSSYS